MHEERELLRQFAEEDSQDAFAELVRRKIDLVYAAALRQVGGDSHLAQDVTQAVFLALAGQAAALQRHATLTGWLYTTTRFLATKAVRTQARWQRREQEARAMNEILRESDPAWEQLRPVIDEAMHELDEKDRAALLLRFFEGRPLAEVGTAIGLPENSARMRVERALDKLHVRLARRGITSTAAALGVALASQPVIVAPAGLAATMAASSLAGMAASSLIGWPMLVSMNMKLLLGIVGVVMAIGVGVYLAGQRRMTAESEAVSSLDPGRRSELAALENAKRRAVGEVGRHNASRPIVVPVSVAPSTTPGPDATPTPDTTEQRRREVLINLRQIAAAREMFIHSMRRSPVSLTEVVGYRGFLRELKPVDGEDYAQPDLAGGRVFSVTTASGLAISYNTEGGNLGTPLPMAGQGPPALGTNVRKALIAFRGANGGGAGMMPRNVKELLPFFDNASDAADYVEWVEAIRWPGRL